MEIKSRYEKWVQKMEIDVFWDKDSKTATCYWGDDRVPVGPYNEDYLRNFLGCIPLGEIYAK